MRMKGVCHVSVRPRSWIVDMTLPYAEIMESSRGCLVTSFRDDLAAYEQATFDNSGLSIMVVMEIFP